MAERPKRTLPEALDAARDGIEFQKAIQGLFAGLEEAMDRQREEEMKEIIWTPQDAIDTANAFHAELDRAERGVEVDGKYTIDPDDPEAGTPEEALQWLLNRRGQR